MAQAAADAKLRESRRGIDETEASVAARLPTIRSRLARGLSPQQIAALHPELDISASTAYRWVDAGYAEMTDLDLKRKVGCGKNHEELRKLLPKGRVVSFEQLTRRHGAGHVAGELRAARQTQVPDTLGDAARRVRGRRPRAHGRVRRRGAQTRRARPDARPRRAGVSEEG